MDDKRPTATSQDDQPTPASTNRRTKSTTPTVYPEVDFVNRTEP